MSIRFSRFLLKLYVTCSLSFSVKLFFSFSAENLKASADIPYGIFKNLLPTKTYSFFSFVILSNNFFMISLSTNILSPVNLIKISSGFKFFLNFKNLFLTFSKSPR